MDASLAKVTNKQNPDRYGCVCRCCSQPRSDHNGAAVFQQQPRMPCLLLRAEHPAAHVAQLLQVTQGLSMITTSQSRCNRVLRSQPVTLDGHRYTTLRRWLQRGVHTKVVQYSTLAHTVNTGLSHAEHPTHKEVVDVHR